jgi:hypothetical protein
MSSEAKEKQLIIVQNTLSDFVKILVKEYSLIFKDGSGFIKVNPSEQPFFPYEVSLEIKRKR